MEPEVRMASNSKNNNNSSNSSFGFKPYSCNTTALTLQWVEAIVRLLRQYEFLWRAHVVDFFQARLWESVDKEWMECLREESVHNLLLLPSGLIQDNWPTSLKEFLHSAQSLTLPRDARTSLAVHFPGLCTPSLGKVLTQGMNFKKIHEVEVLSAVIQRIANEVEAHDIIDVGAGQGYLAQVLSFEYQLSVIALDASAHHATVTNQRAQRIKKHYQARMRKSHMGHHDINMPQTITHHICSDDSLASLSKVLSSSLFMRAENNRQQTLGGDRTNGSEGSCPVEDFATRNNGQTASCDTEGLAASLVLAGLHACGDLSVTMARTFLECKEVKALISIGCCYNLLSEDCNDNKLDCYGFPLSNGVTSLGIHVGRNGRDLACQSAERWRSLTPEAAIENFEVHAFRAAFQMVLQKFYPNIVETSPSLGRLGKSQRRQKAKSVLWQRQFAEKSLSSSSLIDCENQRLNMRQIDTLNSEMIFSSLNGNDSMVKKSIERGLSFQTSENLNPKEKDGELRNRKNICNDFSKPSDSTSPSEKMLRNSSFSCGRTIDPNELDKSCRFKEYSISAFERLCLSPVPNEAVLQTWKEVEHNVELIGPYWSLRAVFGPLLETLLLLDRLLFLQEHDGIKASIVPLFEPSISPRNIAIIAQKV